MDVMAHGGTDPLLIVGQSQGPLRLQERPHNAVMRTGEPVKNKTFFVRRANSDADMVLRSSAALVQGSGKQRLVVRGFDPAG
jgi:hypothetical protein